jgi:hypothetical protein
VPNWGDVPTWIAAVGTVLAFVVAFVQIANERRHRHEAEARDRAERHIEQARLVSAFMGPKEWEPGSDEPGRTAINLVNGSDEPVYTLVVCIVFIQGAGPQTAEDQVKFTHDAYPRPVATVSILPSGQWRVWIPGSSFSGILGGRNGAEVAFTDRAGSHWMRRATGKLEELKEEPLKYFEQFGLYGPYDFLTPEPSS